MSSSGDGTWRNANLSRALMVADLRTIALSALATPLPSVWVLDAGGRPVSAATVIFTPDVGQATSVLTGATQVTGVDGIATLGSWNVGTVPGATLRVRAFVTGLNQGGNEPSFIARTSAGAATVMTLATGSTQTPTAQINTAVAQLPAVRIADSNGNPVAGVVVQFAAAW